MKLIGYLTLCAAIAMGQSAPEIQLKAAAHKQEVEGDLKGAMEAYRQIIAKNSKERSVVAQAMLRLAQCHEKLGQTEAKKLYEQIAARYRDQASVAAQARARLASLSGPAQSGLLTARRISVGQIDTQASLARDGRSIAMTDLNTGDLAIRDMATGSIQRLNLKNSWSDSTDFVQGPVLSRDLRDVAYAWYSEQDGYYQGRVVAAHPGAKPRILLRNPEYEYVHFADWSSDGKFALAAVWRKDGTAQLVWISLLDGSLRILKSLEWRNPQRIVLSPDGRYIAYDVLQDQNAPDRDIYVLAADGSRESRLVAGAGHETAPSWTPDGSRIIFLSNRSGRMDLWSLEIREGKPEGVLEIVKSDIGNIFPIGFTQAGSFFYVHNQGDEDIYTIDLDSHTGKSRGTAARLAQSFLGHNTRAAWSPDGAHVAFHSERGHSRYGPGAVSLVVRSSAKGEEKVFPSGVTLGQRPVWFHKSAAILEIAKDARDKTSFFRADLASGKLGFLTTAGAGIGRGAVFAIAPDDTTIYANVFEERNKHGVVRHNLVSGEQTRIYTISDGFVTGLSLSRKGEKLAVMLETREQDKRRQCLAVLRVDGKGFRELIKADISGAFVPTLGLAWSPDDRWVYFVRVKQPQSELWRVQVESGASEYTGISANAMKHIDVSADGSRLAYTAGQRANPELWVLENVMTALKAER